MVRGLRLVATDLAWLIANAAAYGGRISPASR